VQVQRLAVILMVVMWPWKVIATPLTADIAFAQPTDRDDLALRQIQIDSGFEGMKMLLFGARHDAGDVVVVIRGPRLSYVVRKKERVAGIWVNKSHKRFDDVHGFYAVSATRPLKQLANDHLLQSMGIDTARLATFSSRDQVYYPKEDEFTQAVLNRGHDSKLYATEIGRVNFIGDTLFRTIIDFPENIPRGTYTAEVYLFSNGKLVGMQSTPVLVKKTGFDAWVFDLAYNHSLLYGLLAVLCALAAGWAAGAVFRRV